MTTPQPDPLEAGTEPGTEAGAEPGTTEGPDETATQTAQLLREATELAETVRAHLAEAERSPR